MDSFESVFKYLRQRQNLTQVELADKLGVSKSTISMYENGNRKPEYEMLEKIADFFNVDMNFLTAREDLDDHYYTDPEARELANQIYQDDNLRILFDAAKDVSADEIRAVVNILEQFKKTRR